MMKRRHNSSFRDDSGYVFWGEDGEVYRQINLTYKKNYDALMNSGLYQSLIEKQYLIEHEELISHDEDGVYKIIKPKKIPFISYSYEWSFSQLKAAALLTIEIQELAIRHGMTLKDASAFNIQFDGIKPIFIDTLSFELSTDDCIWAGYRQFCQHFLAPLLLMSKVDARLNQLSRAYIDGIPLELTANLLPLRARFNLAIYVHIFMHSRFQFQSQKKEISSNKKGTSKRSSKLTKLKMLGILDSLKGLIKKLKKHDQFSEWNNYYQEIHYQKESEEDKIHFFKKYVECINQYQNIEIAIDIGSNNGHYTNIVAKYSKKVIAIDSDISCIEHIYEKGIKEDNNEGRKILPLVVELCNPSPGIGWDNNERDSFFSRKKFDLTIALAITHHLVVSNNLSFEQIAHFFSKFSKNLIIEFVPKNDPMLLNMISARSNQFKDYDIKNFEKSFARYFHFIERHHIKKSTRIIYLMKNFEKI